MLPVLPRKRLSFVLLTQVFVLMQHFLPAHRTRRLSILCGAQKCLSRIVLLRCPLPPAIPTHSEYTLSKDDGRVTINSLLYPVIPAETRTTDLVKKSTFNNTDIPKGVTQLETLRNSNGLLI